MKGIQHLVISTDEKAVRPLVPNSGKIVETDHVIRWAALL